HPDRFVAVRDALASAGLELGAEDTVSRMPRGFEDLKDSPLAPALRLRSFMVRRALTARQVQGGGLVGAIAGLGEDALPLLRFGWDAIDEARAG
ncbi:MAG TPA: hypothetical protein VE650_20630, partial [Acetobacteraceae bacterium]|nr:hypothetical protein [Acetobacteraceae bacterium]